MKKMLVISMLLLALSGCREEQKAIENLECMLIDGIMVCPGVEIEDPTTLQYCRYELVAAEGKNCKEPRYLCMPCLNGCEPEITETINACQYTMKLIEADCTDCFELANKAE